MMKMRIKELLKELDALLVAHYYQRDEVVEMADLTGDSLELSRKASASEKSKIIFCGVGFMGQSVKILAPNKRVFMPKIACCSMARMIDDSYFDTSIAQLKECGITEVFPITYINSNAEVKARVAELGGVVCTSSNASRILKYALEQKKKIFFLPDFCLGQNLARENGLKSAILGVDSVDKIKNADVICYYGFCSVHQLFSTKDIDFYRTKYPGILIAVHPECQPEVVERADFVGSTSQIIKFVQGLDCNQKVAVGTEFNLVNRLRVPVNGIQNTFVLSSTKPECPTMNETGIEDVLKCLEAIKKNKPFNEVLLNENIAKKAKQALDKMLELS
ncbi:quinolinate synthetase [Helicobacter winghamensis]|uniref:Quinolinate synthase n=2 Tax=Helicobacter winghamensis TaxID=157268 RepID=A0A2N3PL97_9HELI|nr:quinolinate synthase NadA [Helicobacter winghamensis]EEO26714.1 quinolinate synthetase complex, A subunit [Helicobacter winghamensis ATCC BAA-430]PKT79541.1 quinolinate synthetase [Helicobacter winghamensis]PKT79659.1 quinolinate synthetase [Helicobacter winghamensis]PKT79712.1 quinolinate synthetase [Helicobacter winghamensis]PKT82510.1 quinolinate synthetase [Helicobacter winghamensis]